MEVQVRNTVRPGYFLLFTALYMLAGCRPSEDHALELSKVDNVIRSSFDGPVAWPT